MCQDAFHIWLGLYGCHQEIKYLSFYTLEASKSCVLCVHDFSCVMQHALKAKTRSFSIQRFSWWDGRRRGQPPDTPPPPSFSLYRLWKKWHLVKSHAYEHLRQSIRQFKRFHLRALVRVFNHCVHGGQGHLFHHRARRSLSINGRVAQEILASGAPLLGFWEGAFLDLFFEVSACLSDQKVLFWHLASRGTILNHEFKIKIYQYGPWNSIGKR